MAEPLAQLQASATTTGVFNQVTDEQPDEYPVGNLPSFVVGSLRGPATKHSTKHYDLNGTWTIYLVQAASDGEAALNTLRKTYLTQLFADDPAFELVDFDRGFYDIGGDRLRVEILHVQITEEIEFS